MTFSKDIKEAKNNIDVESNNHKFKELRESNDGSSSPTYLKLPSFSNNFQPMKIETKRNDQDENKDNKCERKISIILFLSGFILLIPWIVNVIHLKSRDKVARGLSIASITLFSLCCLVSIMFVLSFIILFSVAPKY